MTDPQGVSKGVYLTYAIVGIAVFALIAYILANAGFRSSSNSGPGTRDSVLIPVIATIYPYGFLAERIGGEHVEVTVITPAGAEPHDYEPTPHDIVISRGARLFLLNGFGMDVWAERIEPDIAKAGAETLTFAPQAPRTREGMDPHVWLDPVFMQTAALLVRDALIRLDPANTDAYRNNADGLVADLQGIDAAYRDGLMSCALSDIVVSHDAFTYLADRYGFHMAAVAGLTPNEDPSPKRLADIADLVREKRIGHVFFETLVSPKITETIAAETGAQTLVLNPIGGLTGEELSRGATYLTVMQENLTNLRTALQCP